MLQPNFQAVHVNLFAKSLLSKREEANDVIFVLPEGGSVQPVLQLRDTSLYTGAGGKEQHHRDSIVAIFPSPMAASEVVWEQFSQDIGGLITPSFVENTMYRWTERGFRKTGTLPPEELDERLKRAFVLTRSSAITPLRLEVKMPGPNEPAP